MFDCVHPHRVMKRLVEIDCDELVSRGMRGVLLDLDNTLTGWNSMVIAPDIERWIGALRQAGLTACIVSNAVTARRVRPVADRLGLPWVTRACKPLRRGYLQGMRLMGTVPDTTVMVGDQLFTDIFGGNRLGLLTILVDPVSNREPLHTCLLQRPLERLLGRRAK